MRMHIRVQIITKSITSDIHSVKPFGNDSDVETLFRAFCRAEIGREA